LLFDLGRERHSVRARIDAIDDVDLFLIDQALDLVDCNVRLALRVRIDWNNLVLAGNAATFVAQVDGYLSANCARDRASRRERTGMVENDTDADGFRLRARNANRG
jgi:hypothetical protein